MKEQIVLYGVCLAISVAAVAVTSFIKLIVGKIANKCGRKLSGSIKEYIFTPLAIILAATGLFFWLYKFCKMSFDEKFILIVACFSFGTMVLYLLLFQPTRKFAMKIIRSLAQHFKVPDMVEVVKDVLSEAEIMLSLPEEDLQSNAKQDEVFVAAAEKPPDKKVITVEGNLRKENSTDTEADKLRAMVEVIKNK